MVLPILRCAVVHDAVDSLVPITQRNMHNKTSMSCRLLDQETVVYILTLGVTDQYRHLGIASQLIQRVIAYAQHQLCRAVYLHVIEYNLAALSLYRRNKFEELAVLRNFYFIG